MVPVALRSEDPKLIETVRSVLAVNSIPLAVFPESAIEPVAAGLALDAGSSDPAWRARARRYAEVCLRDAEHPHEGALVLPHAAEELLGLARAANRVLRARVVGIVGAAGGVGASVFAATLARAGAEAGLTSALVEGAGNPALTALLGRVYSPGLRWPDLPAAGAEPDHLTASLPRWENVRLLLGDDRPSPDMATSEAVLTALAQTHDLVILDLQRQDVANGVTKRWCDAVLVVTTCSVAAASATRALCATLTTEDVHLVVRGPAKGGLSAGELAESARAQVLVYMRAERSLPAGLERGLTPGDHRRGPLLRAARSALDGLGAVEP